MTAANMAGVQQAKAGFLGMNASTLALAAGLGILVAGGKKMLDTYQEWEVAQKSLSQAVSAYDSNLGKTVKAHSVYHAGLASTVHQVNASASAHDRVKFATDRVTLAEMHLAAVMAGKKHTVDQVTAAQIHLRDAQLRLTEAERAAASHMTGTAGTAGHWDHFAGSVKRVAISLTDLQNQFDAFINTNKRYVSNQMDAETALASFVRAGNNARDSMRLLNDALDWSVLSHQSVSEAGGQLIKVLAGNSRMLRALGITTAEYNAIMKDKLLSTEEKHIRLMALIESKTKDGRKAQDDAKQSANELNNSWVKLSKNGGPVLEAGLKAVTDAANAVYDAFDHVGKDDKLWSNISDRLVDMAKWIKQYIIDPIQAVYRVINPQNGRQQAANEVVASVGRFGYGGQPSPRAAGGPVGGGDYLVGERGPEIRHFGASGSIVPNGGNHVHLHIGTLIGADGPGMDRLAREILQRARFAPGM